MRGRWFENVESFGLELLVFVAIADKWPFYRIAAMGRSFHWKLFEAKRRVFLINYTLTVPTHKRYIFFFQMNCIGVVICKLLGKQSRWVIIYQCLRQSSIAILNKTAELFLATTVDRLRIFCKTATNHIFYIFIEIFFEF